MSILIGIFTFILILVSLFLVLVILAQKSKNDGGMGAALGGGMAEATFGADTGNVLSKSTINAVIAFFVLCFGLYLAHLHVSKSASADARALPTISVPVEETAAEAAPAADAVESVVEEPAVQIDLPAATEEQPAQP